MNFTEPGGLGSTGYHEGQEDVQERIGTKPTISMLQSIITKLARRYQNAPRELEFHIDGLDSDDEAAADEVIDTKFRRGSLTLNDTRDAAGEPRYAFPEADMPMIVTDRGVIFLEGSSEQAPPGELVMPSQAPPGTDQPPAADFEPDDDEAGAGPERPRSAAQLDRAAKIAELAAYRNWTRHGRGRKGATFELRSLTRAEAAAASVDSGRVTFKAAGDASPKGQAPDDGAESARDWPGWQLDLDAAQFWSTRIADALSGAVDAEQLAEAWIAHVPTIPGAAAEDEAERLGALTGAAEQWIERERQAVTVALTDVLTPVYTDGYVIGATSARAVMEGQTEADVGEWVTGDTEAAQLLLGELGDGAGLRTMLNQAGITIKSIVDTRLEQLGRALADGVARGDSPGQLATAIRRLLENKTRALMIATTELARAVSTAAVNQYRLAGHQATEWATAHDDRVCPTICEPNEAEGPVPIGDPYPSGDYQPPGHPWCRCAPLPVIETDDQPTKGDAR